MDEPTDHEEPADRSYLFRGDDNYRGGAIGKAFGIDADSADIQNFADHILRKESHRTSRYTSFSTEVKVARRFTSVTDNRRVIKAEMVLLRQLEQSGTIQVWDADQVFNALCDGPKKLARQASNVRESMSRNCEILIEGLIPADVLSAAN